MITEPGAVSLFTPVKCAGSLAGEVNAYAPGCGLSSPFRTTHHQLAQMREAHGAAGDVGNPISHEVTNEQ